MSERARPGVGRLALETGVPIVPIAVYGSSKIRHWRRLRFPEVTVQYGDALSWETVPEPTREQQQAVADEVLREIRTLYDGLEEHGRDVIRRRVREQAQAKMAV